MRKVDNLPEHFKAPDGFVYLDLSVDFDISSTISRTEITDANNVKLDFSIGANFPDTPKNRKIFSYYRSVNQLDACQEPLNVDVISGSKIYSSQILVRCIDENGIESELRLNRNHWARFANECSICDLDDEILMTCENVKNNILNNYPWQDGQPCHWFPFGDYGDLRIDKKGTERNNYVFPLDQARPYFYITPLLKKLLWKNGWRLKSPYLESECGRTLVAYLGRSDYGILERLEGQRLDCDAEAQVNFDYRLVISNVIQIPNPFNFHQVNFGSGFTQDLRCFRGNGVYNISGVFKFKLNSLRNGEFTIELIRKNRTNVISELCIDSLDTSSGFTQTGENLEWEFEAECISLTCIDEICVIAKKTFGEVSLDIQAGSFINFEAVRKTWGEGDVIKYSDWLDCNITLLDIIKGVSHLPNLKFATNLVTQELCIYQPYTVELGGEEIEGFFIEESIEDILNLVDDKSIKVCPPDPDQQRFIELKFKEDKDQYIEDSGIEDLWSKVIDLGEKFTNTDTLTIENHLFHPTLNQLAGMRGRQIQIPKMYNERGKENWEICPRIGYAFGAVKQQTPSAPNPKVRMCKLDDDLTELIPTWGQYITIPIGDHNDVNSTTNIPDKNYIFGHINNVEGDGCELFWKKWLEQTYGNSTLDALINLDHKLFCKIDFRKKYCLYVDGILVNAYMNEVNDFKHCERISTPVELLPDKIKKKQCEDIESLCNNNPVLFCNKEDQCIKFSVGGNNEADIQIVSYEYDIGGGFIPLPTPNTSPTQAEICDICQPFQLKAVINYDDFNGVPCEPVEIIKNVSFPHFSEPEINCNWSYITVNNRLVRAVGLSVDFSLVPPDIFINNSEASGDGVNYFNYGLVESGGIFTTGNLIEQIGNPIFFRFTYTIDNCDPITIIHECNFDDFETIDACSLNFIKIGCQKNSNGCFLPIKIYQLNSLDIDEKIKYRCSTDGLNWGEWLVWDGQPICCEYIQMFSVIIFCDDICPTLCSEIISCDPDGNVTTIPRPLTIGNTSI